MGTTLTDSEKFKKVFDESGLNQAKFAEKIGITPGSLSGIFNGRTNPTINMLRNLTSAFPEINPMWLFSDDENMHVGDHVVQSPTVDSTSSAQKDLFDNTGMEGTLFDFGALGEAAKNSSVQQTVSRPVQPVQKSAPVQETPKPEINVRNRQVVPQIDPNTIAATLAMTSQKPPRKITEIRIFFDDGTYETYGPK